MEAEIRALADYIEELTIIPASPARNAEQVTELPATVVRLPVASVRTLWGALRMCAADPRSVVRAFRSVILPPAPLLVRLKNLAVFPKALAVAHIVRRERIDHIHSYWLSTPSTVAFVAAQIARTPWSSTAHRFDIYDDNLPNVKARSASFIRTISQRGLTDFRKRIVPAYWERSIVLHLGINVPPGRAASAIESRKRPFTLLCAAALIPRKGHEVLLDALSRLRDSGIRVRCVLAGDGPLRNTIASQIRRWRLTSVVTMRYQVPHDMLLRQLQAGDYDAVILPSSEDRRGENEIPAEGIPVTLMEAMAAGLPCIATDSGSITELLDASCGIVVAHSDAAALAKAILTLASDPARGADLGMRGRQRVEEQYNARHTAAILSALWRRPSMLEEHPAMLASMEA